MLDSLYQEIILEHYKSPRNFGKLENPDAKIHSNNPSCGDELELQILVRNQKIEEIKFCGRGCAISQASASMMTDMVKGKTLPEAQKIAQSFHALVTGDGEPECDLGDLEALAGVKKFPIRVKCATLAWAALNDILEKIK